MSMDFFSRFSPYIQDYIYRQGWSELRPVQLAAAEALFTTDDHLLLSTGTASGKTEAALLPALTLLNENPAKSVGILYVSPLKALINDQFARLRGLLEEGRVPVTRWHGDAPAGGKARLLKDPAGVLQITPESLESLLMHRRSSCAKLFEDLRFVVVDEVHYFMACERGVQLQCLLARLERIAGCSPRRIGLSATLGSPEAAAAWLGAGTDRPCRHPAVPEAKRRLLLHMRRFEPGEQGLEPLLYTQTLGKKAIVFTRTRLDAENVAIQLKEQAAARKTPDVYRVHHGSLSAALREEAEREMKTAAGPVVTAATVTLELGIDIGGLDRVVQLGAPLSVSSFTQRIGRCGRQGQPAELLFLLQSELEPQPGDPLGCIDWEFIKAIATIRLYLEEKWIEPITPPGQSFTLCYHQTMCLLAAAGEMSPARLAQEILTLPAFRQISREDYRILLRHLLDTDHLRRGDAGGLLLGAAGEAIATAYDFLAVFTAPDEWQVTFKGKPIGTVAQACPTGERIALAGRGWEVTRCDEARKLILVKPAQGPAESKWESFFAGRVHARVLEKMRAVLEGEGYDAYLSPESCQALETMRIAWKARTPNPIVTAADTCLLFPWLGTPALQALQLALQDRGIYARILPGGYTPVYLACHTTEYALRRTLSELRAEGIDPEELPLRRGLRAKCKFDPYLPGELLQKQTREECVDAGGAMGFLRRFP